MWHVWVRRGGVQGLGGETGGKETTRRRWADNIRMDLQEVGCVYMDWIGLAQDRDRWWTLVSAVMNLRVPWNVGSFLTSCRPVSFSRRTLHHGVSKEVRKMMMKLKQLTVELQETLSDEWGVWTQDAWQCWGGGMVCHKQDDHSNTFGVLVSWLSVWWILHLKSSFLPLSEVPKSDVKNSLFKVHGIAPMVDQQNSHKIVGYKISQQMP